MYICIFVSNYADDTALYSKATSHQSFFKKNFTSLQKKFNYNYNSNFTKNEFGLKDGTILFSAEEHVVLNSNLSLGSRNNK